MAMIRCGECNASHPVPADPAVTSMRCPYCGAAMAVPDAEARRRDLLEQQREARLHDQQRAAEAREVRREHREDAERQADRKQRRSGRWGARIMTLIAVLAAPTIIAITVFDLPARLGVGASGADRLDQLTTQLRSTGCITIAPVRSTYATGTLSQLVTTDAPGCLRVLAAGAGDHRTLALRLFDATGTEVGSAKDTLDPHLTYCPPSVPATLRYEIVVGPAAKGRLSHTVLRCPAAPPKPASAPSQPDQPPKKRP